MIVLAWLYSIIASQDSSHCKFARRSEDGDRCVFAARAEIARETGLSVTAAKRGLEKLEVEHLIEILPYQRRLCVFLTLPPPSDQHPV